MLLLLLVNRNDIAGLSKAKQMLNEATVWPVRKPAWFKGMHPVSVSCDVDKWTVVVKIIFPLPQ